MRMTQLRGDAADGRRCGTGTVPPSAFRRVVDTTAVPFVLVDRLGTIRYASGSIAHVFGWDARELVGQNIATHVDPEHIGVAAEAMAQIDAIDRSGIGIPITLSVQHPDGRRAWVEAGAVPLDDDLVAVRLRRWDAEYHLDEFVTTLLEHTTLDAALPPLARSCAAAVDAAGAAVHHGFDGRSFVGTCGSWPGAADLARDAGPWCDLARAVADGGPADIVVVESDGGPGNGPVWLVPVASDGPVAPAVLSVWRHADAPILVNHRQALERLVRYVELALVRVAEHHRLLHLARHDPLTGVANRSSFRDRLAEALAMGERDIAVAFCDLDGFKPVNDVHGHGVGDAVLVEVADRFRSALRVGDELARIGGDEFTLLLRCVPDGATAAHVAERVRACIAPPVAVPGGTVEVGLSVGIAMAGDGATADGLLSAADAALYASKRAGGGCTTVVG